MCLQNDIFLIGLGYKDTIVGYFEEGEKTPILYPFATHLFEEVTQLAQEA